VVICVSANPSLDQIVVTDGFRIGGQTKPKRWTVAPGGGAVRVAGILAQLGVPVVTTGLRGGGAGGWHADLMDRMGLKQDFVRIAGETRGKVFVLDEKQGLLFEIPGHGPVVTPEECDELVARVSALVSEGDWVVISGSLPYSADPALYSRLVRAGHENGARVAVDTRREPLRDALSAVPDIWKPNAAELQDAIGRGVDPVAQCERGTSILLSEGSNGALLFRPGRTPRRFTPPRRPPWNPAGSGTALLAATVAALHGGAGWDEAVSQGLAAGVANMRYDVAGFATRNDVAELMPHVSIDDESD
jgi:1-phosphofructokinase family hexose kinase